MSVGWCRTLPCSPVISCCVGTQLVQKNLLHLLCTFLHQSQNIPLCHRAQHCVSTYVRTFEVLCLSKNNFAILLNWDLHMFWGPSHLTLLTYTHHGDSHLTCRQNTFINTIYLHIVTTSWIRKRPLTVLPCNITLTWHHSFKGTLKGERNAEDSSNSPPVWTCSWPVCKTTATAS